MAGEAASQLPQDVRASHPEVPWRDLIDLRNVLIHAYHRVDYQIVWEIVTEQLGPLIVTIQSMLAQAKGADPQ